MNSRYVDLSHPIEHGMVTYPGLPGPAVSTHRERVATAPGSGVSFHIGRIDLVANTGTYVDAPFHFHAGGADIAGLALERLVDVPAVRVSAYGRPVLGPDLFGEPDRLWGKAVLVHTGWSRHWGTPRYGEGAPYLTAATARFLVDANVAVLGVDAVNVDDPTDPARPVHDTLLGNGIPIIEHLTNLAALPAEGFRLTALPAPVRGIGSFPVRAVAVLACG
ncbi:MAG: cyclase family protein [Actinophytocola sp.]|uniref:cyclase family protein n=1 Tax=Actinophytocola sp. TaxID=1872138 RepID=UPI0013253CC4|nr:cyclase family protein [Actinophytocola sp.]MPZ82523.1 cyclase family protein [Actinophytocola sp.]